MIDAGGTRILADVERVRRRTRLDLSRLWFPMVLFGALTLLSAVVSSAFDSTGVGVFWSLAGPGGAVAVAVYYRRAENALGLAGPRWPYAAGAAVIFVGAFSTGLVGGVIDAPVVSAVGPALAVSVGYLCFAWGERRVGLAVVAVALAALAVVMAVAVDAARAETLLALAYGVVLVVSGLVYRRLSRPSRQAPAVQ